MHGDPKVLEGTAEAARKLFPNQGLHRAAVAIACAHPRALQYLEQAPVLALAIRIAGRVTVERHALLFAADKLRPACDKGAPLREIMALFGIPGPMRKLRASALAPRHESVIFGLRKVDPIDLGRIIPERAGKQRSWLGTLADWMDDMASRSRRPDTSLVWAADAFSRQPISDYERRTLTDFITRGDGFSEVWGVNRALEEASIWHARLDLAHVLKGTPLTADTRIDFGDHPDVAKVGDLDFVALRTPAELVAEGSKMRHCVASYVRDVFDGRSTVIAVRRGDAPVATLEIRAGSIRQIAGRCNAPAPPNVRAAAQLYVAMLSEKSKREAA